ncbi:hypothetical protein GCM10011578_019950 [Streptomyces fuscichromogenes]|uniref:Uncharacterized protein n=1 Tax=Streptomyces fuscichromogenes TaxID=1324013 RepID=A0A918CQ93_9ACTN|nr:hypothetical protein GCM10011578_019950 [Streptomyces fuscichromogenes]
MPGARAARTGRCTRRQVLRTLRTEALSVLMLAGPRMAADGYGVRTLSVRARAGPIRLGRR